MTAPLNEKPDLTRWNRAGLTRFRYIDGNAVTYLEALRLAMKEAFTDSAGDNLWLELDTQIPVEAGEGEIERVARWRKQYFAERRDHGWEILRALARSTHVLAEHVDAYANEHFLATATEWESIRRLVSMLDYTPAPPASASTPVAIMARAAHESTADGLTSRKEVLKSGFAVKDKPADGAKPSVFETLQDLELDPTLNVIRPKDWNLSQEDFDISSTTGADFPLAVAIDDVSAGDRGVLLVDAGSAAAQGFAVTVTAMDPTLLQLDVNIAADLSVKRHRVTLLIGADLRRQPQLSGADVAVLSPDHGLNAGGHVAFLESSSWKIAAIVQVEVNRVRLSRSAPAAGTGIHATAFSNRESYDVGGSTVQRIVMPTHVNDERIFGADWDENLHDIGSHQHATEGGSYLYDYIDGTAYDRIYYVPDVDPVATVVEANPSGIRFDRTLKGLNTGDWLHVVTASGDRAVQVVSKDEGDDAVSLVTDPIVTGVVSIRGSFRHQLRPLDHDRNRLPAFLTAGAFRSDRYSTLPVDLASFPDLLRPGRPMMVAGREQAMLVTVAGVDEAAQTILVRPPIPGSEPLGSGVNAHYERDVTCLYANVVMAGHGESQSEKVLGSGDATQSHQAFALNQTDLAYVADSAFTAGIRADIDILVGERTWQQVDRLGDSEPEDHHYMVRLTEDGTLKIEFGGDGHGRRLPSGNNNVRVRFRKGNGLRGNLSPRSLVKAVKPHYLVDNFLQPVIASGGNNLEATESMRGHAPASVLALDRAVSLADFVHLASNNSSVWQASARQSNPGVGRSLGITLAIVPAGGGPSGTLTGQLKDFLTSRALPDVELTVIDYEAVVFDATITLYIDEDAFDANKVIADVQDQLLSSFALRARRLGAPLYRSQLVAAVESVTGVENCQCAIGAGFRSESGAAVAPRRVLSGGDAIKRVNPEWHQVIYLHKSQSVLSITSLPAEGAS